MSNLVHRRRRCARIDPYMIPLPGWQYARGKGRFILVYRLAMDARPERVMVGLAENIQACLRDFLAATASMARKRHLASTARGLCCFCLAPNIHKPIRPIRLIRGKTEIKRTESLSPGEGYRSGSMGAFLYCQRQLFCFLGGLGRSCMAGLGVAA